jgi:RNAse (barnase) inhibitor barstar
MSTKPVISLTINCGVDRSTKAVHDRIKNTLNFPPHYGGNLDALHDSLGDVVLEKKVVLTWIDTKASRRSKKLQALKTILTNTLEEYRNENLSDTPSRRISSIGGT